MTIWTEKWEKDEKIYENAFVLYAMFKTIYPDFEIGSAIFNKLRPAFKEST